MSEHTPGPWEYKRDLWVGKDRKGEIANCCASYELMNCTRKEAEANAKLIATAPELYKENKRLKAINAELLEALNYKSGQQ